MWSRALAGVIPGFVLAAALVGLITWSLPGPWQDTLVPGLIAVFPVWMLVIGASFFFRNGARAWRWLVAAAILAAGGLWLLQSLQWVR